MSSLYVVQRIPFGFSGYLSSAGSPAKPVVQLTSPANSPVKFALSLRGVIEPIGTPAPKVTAPKGEIERPHATVLVGTYEPPAQTTKMWAGGFEIDFIVNLDFLPAPKVGHLIAQAQPAMPAIAGFGLEFHVDLVIVESEVHFAGDAAAGLDRVRTHHPVDIELHGVLDRRPSATSSTAKPAHEMLRSVFRNQLSKHIAW